VSRRDAGYLVLHAIAPHGGAAFTDGRLADRFGFTFSAPGPDRATLDALVATWFARDPEGRANRGGYNVGRDVDMA